MSTQATRPFDALHRVLSSNAQWAEAVKRAEPDFFSKCAKGQSPHTLWIGCSDSRVPESAITGCRPGEIFVHRNVANQFRLDDNNALSILHYAVNNLGVQHVVVVGHSECGGAMACLDAVQNGCLDADGPVSTLADFPPETPINRWLEPLTKHVSTLGVSKKPAAEVLPLVVEENVKRQVDNLCKSDVILNAWTKGAPNGQAVWVHGWVYDIAMGRLRDLEISRGPPN